MTTPVTAPVPVSSVSGQRIGSYAAGMVIVNLSAVEVWIGSTPSVASGIGVPLKPQAATTWIGGVLFAAVDSAAATGSLLLTTDITEWNPSPVTNVTVSGPITVTGTVAISGTVNVAGSVAISGGSVNIGTITGTVTITGPVTVTNTPSVIPLSTITNVINQVVSSPGSPAINQGGLGVYSTAIIQATLSNVSGSPAVSDVGSMRVQGYNGNPLSGGLLLYDYTYFYQCTSGRTPSLVLGGDSAQTTIPLNGITNVLVSFLMPTGFTMTLSLWGTNAQLPISHRSTSQITGPYLFAPSGRVPVTTAAGVNIPVPITSNGVTLYAYSSNTATGAPSTTLTITESINNVIRSFVLAGVAKGVEVPPIVLPNTLSPMYFGIQETVAGATSQWELIFKENNLPVPA